MKIIKEILFMLFMFLFFFSLIFNGMNFNGIKINILAKIEKNENSLKNEIIHNSIIEQDISEIKNNSFKLFDNSDYIKNTKLYKSYNWQKELRLFSLLLKVLWKEEEIINIEYIEKEEIADTKIENLYKLYHDIPTEYYNKYDIKNKDYLIIPKLDISAPILFPSIETKDIENKILQLLTKGVVHRPETQLPDKQWNFFVMWHSSNYFRENSPYSYIFAKLDLLQNWDILEVIYKWKLYIYELYESEIVEPSQIDVYNYIPWYNATLMTCYPVWTDKQRLIAKFKLKKNFNK